MMRDLQERKEYLLKQISGIRAKVEDLIEGEEFDYASLLLRQAADILTTVNRISNVIADSED